MKLQNAYKQKMAAQLKEWDAQISLEEKTVPSLHSLKGRDDRVWHFSVCGQGRKPTRFCLWSGP